MKREKKNMDIQMIVILLLIGFGAGILGGMVGIGGGVVIVPALVYLLGFSQFKAQGTSLAMLMFPVGILAVMQYYKQGHVDFRLVALLALGFLLGSLLGSRFALSLPQQSMKKFFAIVILAMSIKMLFFDKQPTAKESPTTKTPESGHTAP
jgi:uncharacterized membrane protein YfcA